MNQPSTINPYLKTITNNHAVRQGLLRTIIVFSGFAKTPVVPTAQRVPLGVTVIPCRRLLEFFLFGLGTKFQFDPSKFSVKVNCALP